MSILHIQPLPTPEQYYQEFTKVESSIERTGGLGNEIAFRALELTLSKEFAEEEMQVHRHGMYMVDEDADPDDPETYKPCYAYVDGYRTTEKVMKRLYESPFTFTDWFSVADLWREHAIQHELTLSENPIFTQRTTSPMMELGVRGLTYSGQGAFGVIRRLSEQLYNEDQDLAETYILGSGVVIASAALRQRAVNNELLSLIESTTDFDSEVKQLLGDSDESV